MLLKNGDRVTVLNRGHLDDGFKDRVTRIICDRDDLDKFKNSVQHKSWDIVYDQVCFDAHQAKAAVAIFSGRTKKYIFTSTVSVYPPGANIKEELFNPKTHRYDKVLLRDENYGEAKRQCEAVFFAQEAMPVIAVRFPIVMGPDDYTERLKFYVDRINSGEPVYFPNLEARMSYIHAADAAAGLFLLADTAFTGPVNMASKDPLSMRELITAIEHTVGKTAKLNSKAVSENEKSPYGVEQDWFINIECALGLGFKPQEIHEWLVAVIKNYL